MAEKNEMDKELRDIVCGICDFSLACSRHKHCVTKDTAVEQLNQWAKEKAFLCFRMLESGKYTYAEMREKFKQNLEKEFGDEK